MPIEHRTSRGSFGTLFGMKTAPAVEFLSQNQIMRMRAAGRAAALTLRQVAKTIAPEMSTADIDDIVVRDTAARGGTCAQLGYGGEGGTPFPRSVCTSVNQVVCHGVPSPDVRLKNGDIVNVDVTTALDGMHGDTSFTFCIGPVSDDARRLVQTTQAALMAGIEQVRDGARLSDIGAAIEAHADDHGYRVVRDFGGHGIGRLMHMPPHVSHVRHRDRFRLRAGMAITIEPMLCAASAELTLLDDGWTLVTRDGGLSAQFEHTLVVTETGAEVTTAQDVDLALLSSARPRGRRPVVGRR